jgi:hypothetical protein
MASVVRRSPLFLVLRRGLLASALLTGLLGSGSALANDDARNYADAWLRLDADRVGLQLGLGATPAVGPVDLAIGAVVSQVYPGAIDPSQNAPFNAAIGESYRAPTARLELGPALSWGALFVLPKLGIGYDFERQRVAPLVPQTLIIVQAGPLYFESWLQLFLYDVFEAGAQDSFHTRNSLLFALSPPLALGAEIDATVALQNITGRALRSLPIGAVANVQLAPPVTLGLFLGYETRGEARNARHDFIAGRLTATLIWR